MIGKKTIVLVVITFVLQVDKIEVKLNIFLLYFWIELAFSAI